MAKFTIDIPDAVIARVRVAFAGKTQAEIIDWLKHQLKLRVIGYETSQVAQAKEREIQDEIW
jgi:hypothetical protein